MSPLCLLIALLMLTLCLHSIGSISPTSNLFISPAFSGVLAGDIMRSAAHREYSN